MKRTNSQQQYTNLYWKQDNASCLVLPMRVMAFILFFLYCCVSATVVSQSNTYFRTEVGIPYIPVLTAAPSSPTVGMVYINSTDKVMYKYEGSQWVPVGSGVMARITLSPDAVLYKAEVITPDIQYVYSGGVTSSNCAVTGGNYVWYRADDAAGTNKTVITSGTGTPTPYTVTGTDVSKYIGLGVTPVTICNAPAFETVSWRNVSTLTPSISAVNIRGLNGLYAIKGGALTATFTGCSCLPITITGDAGAASTYQWYYANDAAGAGKTPISGKTAAKYTVSFSDGYTAGKYIAVGVTPIASNGDAGTEKMSVWYATAALTPTYDAVSIVGLTEGKAQNNTTLAAITGIYSVTPAVTNTEGNPTYKWYYATDAVGTGKTAITGQTTRTHSVNIGNGYGYIGDAYYLAVGVTPLTTTGEAGAEVLSGWAKIQVIRAPDGTLVNELSSSSGRVWMDRNLGASRAATISTDYLAYGSLYQWCRAADGHERINWTSATTGTPVNGTTTTLSTSTMPGHSLFITNPTSPTDWLTPPQPDGSLWWNGSVAGANSPCPIGYHAPTITEWLAETGISNAATAYSQLKLTVAGYRDFTDGALRSVGSGDACWSSSVNATGPQNINFDSGTMNVVNGPVRSYGFTVRCIKN